MVRVIEQRQSIAQVCGPSLCTQNSIMNAIAAHKDELEKLLENLSGDIPVSGITFVALLDAYITRLDANCLDISARVNPLPAQVNEELIWNQH
jgi:hexokinase